jgi:hypothetical protein
MTDRVIQGGHVEETITDTIGGSDCFYVGSIYGGKKTLIGNKVLTLIDANKHACKHNKDHLPFDDTSGSYVNRQFIRNLPLTLLRESGATSVLKGIITEDKYHCPRRLYKLMNVVYEELATTYPDIPKPPMHPDYKPSIAFYDRGLYDEIDRVKDMCMAIEKYYGIVLEYMNNLSNVMGKSDTKK